jgi:hypothetical protein
LPDQIIARGSIGIGPAAPPRFAQDYAPPQTRLAGFGRSGKISSGGAHIAETVAGTRNVPLIAGALGRMARSLKCLLGGGKIARALIQAVKQNP